MDSLSSDDRITWRTIRKELEEIGITVTAFEANRDFILHWLSHAMENGAFEEHIAPDSESEPPTNSPSMSSDSITFAASNAPSPLIDVNPDTEHRPSASSTLRSLVISTESESSKVRNPSLLVVKNGGSSTERRALSLVEISKFLKPSVACERCGDSNIAYQLHMHCEQCKDGNYDLCLRCWRLGRGCLNWYGFGEGAMSRWNREVGSKVIYSSDREFPHFLTGRRNRLVKTQKSLASQGDGAVSAETYDSDGEFQLLSGFFCSNCSNFAQHIFWVCDVCNDGEWGYCDSCVSEGRCCTHPLLPVNFPPSSAGNSSPSQPSKTTQTIIPLVFDTNCDICNFVIPPSDTRFHYPQCDGGDYDVCTNCYLQINKQGMISEANGPQGWRRCPKDHRMMIVGFEDSARGRRRVVVNDLVGGHLLNSSDQSLARSVFPPSGHTDLRVVAVWSYWPKDDVQDELAFPRGAEIRECEIINSDWSWGVYCGKKGLFPGNYGVVVEHWEKGDGWADQKVKT